MIVTEEYREELVELSIGDIIKTTIKEINKGYLLVKIGDTIGYIPSSEYIWGIMYFDLKEKYQIGDEISAIVINISDKGVMLSIKRLNKDPWLTVDSWYRVGDIVNGKIIEIKYTGVVVEIGHQIYGFLYKGRMNIEEDMDHSELFKVDQLVRVKIISIQRSKRKLSFTMK